MITNLMDKLGHITMTSERVTEDILLLQFTIVNACIVGSRNYKNSGWVLVDTALRNSKNDIVKASEECFGEGSRPQAIILTHGHFDHIGSVIDLINYWKVPVYAHELELPYLTGKRDYPSGDPTVDGGMIAELSPDFPNESINLGDNIHPLPSDGRVPGMPGWRWISSPGHTPGHISLFKDSDGTLIVGDAFTTVKQESALSVLTQNEQISGPPKYFTTDWKAAEESVNKLRELKPSFAIVSHGQPMRGDELTRHLEMLIEDFSRIAVPAHGRYVE